MHKALLFALILAVFAATVSAGGLSRHSESKAINKLLDDILSRLGSKGKVRNNFLKKEQAKVDSLRKQLSQAEKNLEEVEDESNDLSEKDEAERALILKIKAMLKHDAGSDKSHPAQNCDEVFLDDAKSSGKYWIVQDGQPKLTMCVKTGGYPVLSTGCSKTVKGGSHWTDLCLDSEDYNTAADYLEIRNSREMKIKKDGFYRIVAHVTMYSSNPANHYFELRVNNRRVRLAYRNAPGKFTQEQMDLTLQLKKGQVLSWRTYNNGNNRVNYQGKDGATGYNRVQVSFEGEDIIAARSYQKGHAGAGWQRQNSKQMDYDRSFGHFTMSSDGFVTIKKAGFYRINCVALQYTNGGQTKRHGRLLRNGGMIQWSHDEGHSGTWATAGLDATTYFEPGNRLECQWYVPRGHSMHAGNGHEHYTYLEVFYKGDSSYKIMSRGCSRHGDGRSFSTGKFCLNHSNYNNLISQKFVRIANTNQGKVEVLKSGMYRVHVRLQQYSGHHHHGRLLLNGKVIDYMHNDGQERGSRAVWSEARIDSIWKLQKGDQVWSEWVVGQKPYAFHSCGGGLTRYNVMELEFLA